MINKLLALSLLSFFLSCSERTSKQFVEINGKTMGTTYNVKFSPVKKYPAEKISKNIEELLIDFNLICSTYISDSEISLINQRGMFTGKISSEFKNLYLSGVRLNKETQQEFDPSIGPLVNLWGFGPIKTTNSPSSRDVEEAKKNSGLRHFLFDGKLFYKKKPEAYLDFSAFAKGRGVDIVYDYLRGIGAKEVFVEIGGEVRVFGDQKTWRLGVESPVDQSKRSAIEVIPLKSGSLATSGDYRNFFKDSKGNKRSHGIRLRSGKPKENLTASVTVFSKENCMTADAWATALMVSNFKKAVKMAESQGVAAYFIYKENVNDERYVVLRTSAWKALFQKATDK